MGLPAFSKSLAQRVVCQFISARTRREREARARVIVERFHARLQNHGALGIAIILNTLFVAGIGTITLRTSLPKTAAIETTIGYFEDPKPDQPDGPSDSQAALNEATTKMVTASPTVATLPTQSIVTTTAQNVLSFQVAAPSGPSAETIKAVGTAGAKATTSTAASGNQTGNGGTQTQGAGTISSTAGKVGTKIGPFNIQAEKIGILLDVSGSMETSGDIQVARKQAASIPNATLIELNGGDHIDEEFLQKFQILIDQKVEAIVWISDLQGLRDRINVMEYLLKDCEPLKALLKDKGIRIYVQSTQWKSTAVAQLAVESGGEFKLLRTIK